MLSLSGIGRPDRSGEHDGEAVAAVDDARPVDGSGHNLPVQLTSFIDRDAEMTQVRALLVDCRLVTLTGAGGVGKTRLALQVARGMRENGLRGRGGSRILQDMFIGLCWFARAGVLRALVAAARLLLAGGLRG